MILILTVFSTIFIDLSAKSEGVVDRAELADENGNVSYGYVAKKAKVDFYLRFFSLDDVFVFHLYPNSYDYRENC